MSCAFSESESSDSSSTAIATSSVTTKSKKSQGKKKSKPEEPKSKIDEKNHQLEPFVVAARWIPLAIDPFISMRDVLLVGLQGRGGRAVTEQMDRDQQYLCLVFEQILPLVPNFMSVLADVRKKPETFDDFVSLLTKGMNSVRSSDAHSFKMSMPMYILPDDESKANFIIPNALNKATWGWNSSVTARFLCPMRLVSKFDRDPQRFCADVQSGNRIIKASSFPMFLYDESKFDPTNLYSGLFQGPLLVKFYRHVFTGPSSSTRGKATSGKKARGIVHKLKAPTPRTIAYVAVMLRWALSATSKFEDQDQDFSLAEFYRNILVTFNERLDFSDDYELDATDAKWIASTLCWWQSKVPGLQRGGVSKNNHDDEDEESDLKMLKAARKMRTAIDETTIDPNLRRKFGGVESSASTLQRHSSEEDSFMDPLPTAPGVPVPGVSAPAAAQGSATPGVPVPGAPAPTAVQGSATPAPPAAPAPVALQTSAAPTTQVPVPGAPAQAKRPRDTTSDPSSSNPFEGDLTPEPSPSPKRSKLDSATGKKRIRKSKRKKY